MLFSQKLEIFIFSQKELILPNPNFDFFVTPFEQRMALINPTASKLTFPEFCEMMANTIHYYDLEFSLESAFRAFDKGSRLTTNSYSSLVK